MRSDTAAAATIWRHLPNLVSLLRIASVIPMVWLMLDQQYAASLWVALVAGLSDALDGWLARRFGWSSRLGGFLDPAADKLLLLAAYVVLAIMAELPWWLAVLVLARDFVILGWAGLYRVLVGPFTARPRRLAKFCTAVQIAFVLLVLLRAGIFPALNILWLKWAVVLFTLGSGLDYVIHWSALARRSLRAKNTPTRSHHDDA